MPNYRVTFIYEDIEVKIFKKAETIESLIEWVRKTFQIDNKMIEAIEEI